MDIVGRSMADISFRSPLCTDRIGSPWSRADPRSPCSFLEHPSRPGKHEPRSPGPEAPSGTSRIAGRKARDHNHLLSTTHQRHLPREPLRSRGHRLHHGVRHPEAHQLRPRRPAHGGRLYGHLRRDHVHLAVVPEFSPGHRPDGLHRHLAGQGRLQAASGCSAHLPSHLGHRRLVSSGEPGAGHHRRSSQGLPETGHVCKSH